MHTGTHTHMGKHAHMGGHAMAKRRQARTDLFLPYAILLRDKVSPSDLDGLIRERTEAGCRRGAHALPITHGVDLTCGLKASTCALRRRTQLVGRQLNTLLTELRRLRVSVGENE